MTEQRGLKRCSTPAETKWQRFNWWLGDETVCFSIQWGMIGLCVGLLIGLHR